MVLDLVKETLIVLVTENTISLSKLEAIAYEIYIVSRYFISGLYKEVVLLQTQVLRVGQVNEPYIELIQENLIENSIQDCLLFILTLHGLC